MVDNLRFFMLKLLSVSLVFGEINECEVTLRILNTSIQEIISFVNENSVNLIRISYEKKKRSTQSRSFFNDHGKPNNLINTSKHITLACLEHLKFKPSVD